MRTTTIVTLVIFLACPSLGRAEKKPLILKVWPGKVPGEKGKIAAEKFTEQKHNDKTIKLLHNVSVPTISIFRPAQELDTGASVVICPGGAYYILAWDLEGEEVAAWLNSIGVTGIVLKYRVPRRPGQAKDKPPLGPLQDAQRALRLVRSKAKEWKLDPKRIGILGFSAGGHLAASAACNFDKKTYEEIDAIDKFNCRPDFAILVYPAYLLTQDMKNLAPEIRVRKQCPPMFFAHAKNDPIVPANSVRMHQALKDAKVPTQMHIFSSGGHGFGLRPTKHPSAHWPKLCEKWLRELRLIDGKSK